MTDLNFQNLQSDERISDEWANRRSSKAVNNCRVTSYEENSSTTAAKSGKFNQIILT